MESGGRLLTGRRGAAHARLHHNKTNSLYCAGAGSLAQPGGQAGAGQPAGHHNSRHIPHQPGHQPSSRHQIRAATVHQVRLEMWWLLYYFIIVKCDTTSIAYCIGTRQIKADDTTKKSIVAYCPLAAQD